MFEITVNHRRKTLHRILEPTQITDVVETQMLKVPLTCVAVDKNNGTFIKIQSVRNARMEAVIFLLLKDI